MADSLASSASLAVPVTMLMLVGLATLMPAYGRYLRDKYPGRRFRAWFWRAFPFVIIGLLLAGVAVHHMRVTPSRHERELICQRLYGRSGIPVANVEFSDAEFVRRTPRRTSESRHDASGRSGLDSSLRFAYVDEGFVEGLARTFSRSGPIPRSAKTVTGSLFSIRLFFADGFVVSVTCVETMNMGCVLSCRGFSRRHHGDEVMQFLHGCEYWPHIRPIIEGERDGTLFLVPRTHSRDGERP